MRYRLVGQASTQADEIFVQSARRWGFDAAVRYDRLILAALANIAAAPTGLGSNPIRGSASLRSYHLRSARLALPAGHRVAEPRHLLIYRIGADDVVELLGFAHERQLLGPAAERARREADT